MDWGGGQLETLPAELGECQNLKPNRLLVDEWIVKRPKGHERGLTDDGKGLYGYTE